MSKFNADNERIKHRYLGFLSGAKHRSVDSVDQVAAALADFEASTGHKDFRLFRIEQAQRYKRELGKATNSRTGKPLAKATLFSRLAALKTFFEWLAQEPGFRSKLNYSDAEYFNLSANEERIAKTVRERPAPSIKQIQHAISLMPYETDIEKRDRALVAFTLVSGARDDAIASLSLKHVDASQRRVHQDAREVRTKNAKTINGTFFPVGDVFEKIVVEWIEFLQKERVWGPDDPLFPRTKVTLGKSGYFENSGLDRKHWKDAGAIRKIFRQAFDRAGLPYFHPHSFRQTVAVLGEKICRTPEEWKAYSQNFGHSSPMTTFNSYGSVAPHRQAEILNGLADLKAIEPNAPAQTVKLDDDQMRLILNQLAKAKVEESA